jgi:hypothetical protein
MVRKVALTFQPDACLGVDFRQVDRNGYAGRTGVPLGAEGEGAPWPNGVIRYRMETYRFVPFLALASGAALIF